MWIENVTILDRMDDVFRKWISMDRNKNTRYVIFNKIEKNLLLECFNIYC